MAGVTFDDLSLNDYGLTERVSHLRGIYFKALPEICVERPRLITRFHLQNGFFQQERISTLDKARAYRYVLENRAPIVRHHSSYEKGMKPFEFQDESLFAGSTTSHFKGVPLYPEFLALTLWPELSTISTRARNPFHITQAETEELGNEIFPHWMDTNISQITRKRCFEENARKYGLEDHAPEMKLLEHFIFFLCSKPSCISHTIPDFSKVIKLGMRAIINEAKRRREQTGDASRKEFYSAMVEVLEGIIAYSKNLSAEALRLAGSENDPVRKKELLDIAEINRHVPEFPARNFREGLTTVWLCWTAIHLENPNIGLSLGRLDQVLYELYRESIDRKIMDVRQALELVCAFFLKIGDHVPAAPERAEEFFGGSGSNQAITLGGIDQDGNDAVNDLTYVMLRATELMKLRDPNVNARYCSGVNPKEYLRRLCEVNVNTGATPAIHNDKAIIKAMTGKGDTLQQARDYGIVGCVEPVSNGRAYIHTASILLNLTAALELTLFNGAHRFTGRDVLISKQTGDPRDFSTFEEFRAAFQEQTQWLIDQATTLNNLFGKVHQDFYPTPLLSALYEGPMDKGKDLIQGGATINGSASTIIGLADVADSLSAIQKVVFEEKRLSFAELLDALDKNYEGFQALQVRLMNPEKTPKYGNEDDVADGNVRWLVEFLDRAYNDKVNYRGGRYRVGYWTMTNHAGFGRMLEAFPNGRKAYENLSSGITPVSGVTPFLTKTLNSVASLPAKCLSSGVALNLKYAPEAGDKNKMLDNFAASVEGYFDDEARDGGVEVQFNIITRETFLDAVAHPEKYPELLVRVSGYTAYFKDLTPQMQKEIIDRSEYLLSSGRAVHYTPFPLQKIEA